MGKKFSNRKKRMDALMRDSEILAAATESSVQAFIDFSRKLDEEIQTRIDSGEYNEWAKKFITDDVVKKFDEDEEFSDEYKEAVSLVVGADVTLEMREYGLQSDEGGNTLEDKSMSQILSDLVDFLPTVDPVQILFAFGDLSRADWFSVNEDNARFLASALIQLRMVDAGHAPNTDNKRIHYLAEFSSNDMIELVALTPEAVRFIGAGDGNDPELTLDDINNLMDGSDFNF